MDDLPATYTHPLWIAEDRSPLPTLFDAEGYPVIDFAPVPQQRRRRFGWDAERQRAFIMMLAAFPRSAAPPRRWG